MTTPYLCRVPGCQVGFNHLDVAAIVAHLMGAHGGRGGGEIFAQVGVMIAPFTTLSLIKPNPANTGYEQHLADLRVAAREVLLQFEENLDARLQTMVERQRKVAQGKGKN